MMAEQKFSELQRLLEVQLSIQNDQRFELLSLYVESLEAQEKLIPPDIILELAEALSARDEHARALLLLSHQNKNFFERHYHRIAVLQIKAAVFSGQMSELRSLVSEFLMKLYEKQNPVIPTWLSEIRKKYLQHDFVLELKELSILLLTNDLPTCEHLTKLLILSCFEKASPKAVTEKISLVAEVLKASSQKAQLDIYQSFCLLCVKRSLEKADFKRLVEMTIYFEDFKFQVLLLNLFHNNDLAEEARQYSQIIKDHPDYTYVYLDKYFPELKPYFFKAAPVAKSQTKKSETPDLTLGSPIKEDPISPEYDAPVDVESELNFLNLLKYQSFSPTELCDLAVSFLQAEMPRVALKASNLVLEQSQDDQLFLKGSYLKLTAELQLQDYRAALDTCLNALGRAKKTEDILSFLYGQAEIYLRLNEKGAAKKILAKIVSIDGKYRLAKERLEKL